MLYTSVYALELAGSNYQMLLLIDLKRGWYIKVTPYPDCQTCSESSGTGRDSYRNFYTVS